MYREKKAFCVIPISKFTRYHVHIRVRSVCFELKTFFSGFVHFLLKWTLAKNTQFGRFTSLSLVLTRSSLYVLLSRSIAFYLIKVIKFSLPSVIFCFSFFSFSLYISCYISLYIYEHKPLNIWPHSSLVGSSLWCTLYSLSSKSFFRVTKLFSSIFAHTLFCYSSFVYIFRRSLGYITESNPK